MPGRPVTVGAVVLHYRRWPDVRRCLDALHGQTVRPDEVVVVDNASGDGSATRLADAYRWVRLVEADENLGYGPGMNLGISALHGGHDAVLLLTHECVLAPDALAILAERLGAEPGLGAVGPLISLHSEPERVFSAGGYIGPRWRPDHVSDPAAVSEWRDAPPRPVAWIDGCALLLRREALEQAGPFDEDYFMYFEETDLLLRFGEAGWRVECVPRALAWQEPGRRPTYLWTRNRLRFLARWAPRRVLAREVLALVRRAVRPGARLAPGRRRAELSALGAFALGRTGPPPARHRPTGSVPLEPLDGPTE